MPQGSLITKNPCFESFEISGQSQDELLSPWSRLFGLVSSLDIVLPDQERPNPFPGFEDQSLKYDVNFCVLSNLITYKEFSTFQLWTWPKAKAMASKMASRSSSSVAGLARLPFSEQPPLFILTGDADVLPQGRAPSGQLFYPGRAGH